MPRHTIAPSPPTHECTCELQPRSGTLLASSTGRVTPAKGILRIRESRETSARTGERARGMTDELGFVDRPRDRNGYAVKKGGWEVATEGVEGREILEESRRVPNCRPREQRTPWRASARARASSAKRAFRAD